MVPRANYAFQPQPGHRLSREQSHNKVFFGRLWVVPPFEMGEDLQLQVAVKSREHCDRARLAGETALYQHLGGIGLRTFKPAGLLHGVEADHLMTYFDGPVVTMDTIEWPELTLDEAWFEVAKAVDTMALLHAEGLFHGDLAFRNVAFDESNQIVIIDPELMTCFRNVMEPLLNAGMVLETRDQMQAADRLVQAMGGEFSAVCQSVDEMILPLYPKRERPRTSMERLKVYKRHIFEPYKHRLQELDEPVRSALLRVYDMMMIKKKAFAQREIL